MGKLKANLTAKKAVAYQTTRNDDKALELYEEAWAQGCDDVYALACYGLLLVRRDQPEKAIEVLKFASKQKLKPEQWAYVFQNLGLAYWKSGNVERAVRVFSRIYEKVTTSTVRGTYGFLLIALGDQTGDYQQALAFNEEALDYDDEDPVILDNMAQLCYRTGDTERAETLFRKALSLRDTQFDSLYYLARLCFEQQKREEAASLIEKALLRPYSNLNTVALADARKLAADLGIDPIDIENRRLAALTAKKKP